MLPIQRQIRIKANKEKAELLKGFFKTGKGQYGEGDMFLGVVQPELRIIAKQNIGIGLPELKELIKSGYHEERMAALLICVYRYKKADEKERKAIYDFYLKNIRFINNWDLVDVTCRDVVGAHLFDKDRKVLYDMARSGDIWTRRIGIISTFYFLWKGECKDSLEISKILLHDKHDLINKAVGWTLREVGKKCGENILEKFLGENIKEMPRVTLRYAIEKMNEKKRQNYLQKNR